MVSSTKNWYRKKKKKKKTGTGGKRGLVGELFNQKPRYLCVK